MKLLFDQNLSRHLVALVEREFPDASYVIYVGMDRDGDTDIWNYAAANGYAIVTKDKDFYQRSVIVGHPPKVIHLRLGNCLVDDVAGILLKDSGHIKEFLEDETRPYLILPKPLPFTS